MTLLEFYYGFGLFVEAFPVVPIILGLRKWNSLPLGFRFFIGFLMSEVIFNLITNYYHFRLHSPNLFLYYFNSFFQSTFILFAFWHFFKIKSERIAMFALWLVCLALLLYDFIFVSKMDYNYLSNFCVNLIISGFSFYFFYTTFPKNQFKKGNFDETELIISAAVVLQFFVKSINIFFEKYILESQYYGLLSIQTRNIYAYFMLLALLIYTYAFYNFKVNEK